MHRRWLPMLLVAGFSGLCSLSYQVVWDRTLRFNFGGDTVASAIVTGSFLLGLGIGAIVFGRWRPNPIRTMAFLELGVGAFAIVSYAYLTSLASAVGGVLQSSAFDSGGLRGAVIVGCILFIIPPSILMGGTLPVLLNWFVPPGRYAGKAVGLVYGFNTLGAALGILAAPFVFLNNVSIPTTLAVLGCGNLSFAAVLFFLSRQAWALPDRGDAAAGPFEAIDETGRDAPLATAATLVLAFLSGFLVLAFEISALRFAFVVRPSNPYNFPAILMPFLVAMALGSIFLTRFRRQDSAIALRRVGFLFITAQLAMMAGVLAASYVVWSRLPFSPERSLIPYLVALVVPYAFLSGGVFPLLLRLAAATGRDLPRLTGAIYLANSVGSFCGALSTQFLGFRLLGTRGVLTALFVTGTATGIYALLRAGAAAESSREQPRPARRMQTAAAAAALLLVIPLLVPDVVWTQYTFGLLTKNFDGVEGSSGIATIEWSRRGAKGAVRVNGMYMSALPDHPEHVLLAGLALSISPRRRVLVLGLGGGGMVHALVDDPEVEEVVAVDWSRELTEVLDVPRARRHLGETLHREDVKVIRADARVVVSLFDDDEFDVVIDNLAVGGWVGSTNIKSAAFYQEIARILTPGGVFVYDANFSGVRQRRANLAALLLSFRHVREDPQQVVLASNEPFEIDPARVEEVFGQRPELELEPPYADEVLGRFKTIGAFDVEGVEPIVDELPIYEYTMHPLASLLGADPHDTPLRRRGPIKLLGTMGRGAMRAGGPRAE